MNTLTLTGMADADGQLLADLKARGRKLAPLAVIVLAHALLFYLLQSGMLRKVAHAALPEVINISFIAPPQPKPSAPPAPKTVQVAHPAPSITPPPLPLLAAAPTEPTITLPQPAAQPAPAAAVSAPVAAAPAPAPAPVVPRNVSSVEYIRAPQPVYPTISRRLGESGTVVLRILISERGLAEQVSVQKTSGFVNLDEAGRQAALRALFKPLLIDGKPVPVYATVALNFELS